MPWDSRGLPVSLETLSKVCGIMLHSAWNPPVGQAILEDSNEISDAPLDFPISTPATPRWSYASPDESGGSQDNAIDYTAGLFAHYVQYSTPEPAMDGTADGITPSHSRGASADTTIFATGPSHSNFSIAESHKTSGASSLSSIAGRVTRHAGPDLRLMNVSKSEWANKFSNGRLRRSSSSSNNSKPSDNKEASVAITTATKTILDQTTPPSSWPLPETPLVTQMSSTEALASTRAPMSSLSNPHRTPSAESPVPRRSSTGSQAEALDESYSPRKESAHSWDQTEGQDTKAMSGKRSRPSFPRWKSHRSQRSKDKRSSGQSDPPLSPSLTSPPLSPHKVEEVTATAIKMEKVTPTRLYQQKSRRSMKRWLWPGPLSASDAQSIGEVIQPHEMQALNPTQGYSQGTDDSRYQALHSDRLADALPHAKALPLTGSESCLQRDRLLSPLNSFHPSSSPPPLSGRGHGFVPPTPDLSTPFTRSYRREGTSYFGISGKLSGTEARRSAHYSPDYISSALGGLSPPETPEDSPEKEEAEKTPEFEYFARSGTARNSTFPAGFSPSDDITPNSPPYSKRRGYVIGSSSPNAAPTHPASQFPALAAHPVRPPRVRRQPASSSSGVWDSDAILMSQPDMMTPDEVPCEAYSYSPSQSKTASTVTTTSLATANTAATGSTTATSATTLTALSDSTVKPRHSMSSRSTSSTTTALPRATPTPTPASLHRPISAHRNSTSSSSSKRSAPPIPPAIPVASLTTGNIARRVHRESARSNAPSLPESTHTTGTRGSTSTGSTSTGRSGPSKKRDWFRVRMDQIMADDVGGAAVGGTAHLPHEQKLGQQQRPPSRQTPRRSFVSQDGDVGSTTYDHGSGANLGPPATVTVAAPGSSLSEGNAGGVGPATGAGAAEFVWDVPEHLPGSPLCPLSPKHRGGGKGICVYHGRRKMQRTAELML